MFIRNGWYVGALSSELGRPVGRTLLGQAVAMFRGEDGRVAAIADRCAHRAAPLSAGRVVGQHLQCPYHGYRFGADGVCAHIPGQEKIPAAARVRAWPVVERAGFVWLWMGERAAADESLIPDFSSNDKPGWAGVSMHMPARASYLLLVENLLDLSHVAFVHGDTIGSDDTSARLSLERGAGFVRSIRASTDIPTPPHNIAQGFAPRCDQTKIMHFTPPGIVTLEITTTERAGAGSKAMHILLHNAMTPQTDGSCHYFWASTRDFQTDDASVSDFFRDITRRAFEEDLAILALQQASIDADPDAPMVSTPNDAAALAARRLIDEALAREAG
jgi:phenylpropionate dioxygenase-like ring-hydroxylating dioxygenase large terminal subunit